MGFGCFGRVRVEGSVLRGGEGNNIDKSVGGKRTLVEGQLQVLMFFSFREVLAFHFLDVRARRHLASMVGRKGPQHCVAESFGAQQGNHSSHEALIDRSRCVQPFGGHHDRRKRTDKFKSHFDR